jgi:hypothetical protein
MTRVDHTQHDDPSSLESTPARPMTPLYALLLIPVAIGAITWWIYLDKRHNEHLRQAEEQRVAALTPEQRAQYNADQAARRHRYEMVWREAAGTTWLYRSALDEMTSKETKYARVKSSNAVKLASESKDGLRATLTLRSHPRRGYEAYMSVENGRFDCSTEGCSISVRFDDADPIQLVARTPADHATSALFFDDYSELLSGLQNARTVRIEAVFYQAGPRIFRFGIEELRWP